MLILGYLSLIQVTFLPGFILYYFFFTDKSALRTLIFSLGLSMIFNHVYVFIFTFAGISFPFAHFSVLIIEILIFTFIIIKVDQTEREFIGKTFLLSLVSLFIILAIHLFIQRQISIMDVTDAVFSWNRWAKEWYNNGFPTRVFHYPQLIPVNWSIIYQYIGNSFVEVFSKSLMPLFYIGIVAISYFFLQDTGFNKTISLRSLLIIVPITLLGYPKITKGLVDIPVSFYCLISLYSLYLSIGKSNKSIDNRYLYLGVVFSAGALITKQTSLIFMISFQVLVLIMHYHELKKKSLNDLIKFYSMIFVIIFFIAGTWYVYNELTIIYGKNTYAVTEKISGGGFLGKIDFSSRADLVLNSITKSYKSKMIFFPALIFSFFSLIHRNYRYIFILIIIPYFLLWSIFASYDTRNLAIGITFWSLSVVIGFNYLLNKTLKLEIFQVENVMINNTGSQRYNKIYDKILNNKRLIGAFITFTLLFLSAIFGEQTLYSKQTNTMIKYLGQFHRLNKELYTYHKKNKISKYIISNYRYVEVFPGLKGIANYSDDKTQALYNFNYFKKLVEDPDTGYILVVDKSWWGKDLSPDVMSWIKERLSLGTYKLVFKNDEGYLVKIR